MCFIHPYNDINEWKVYLHLLFFTKYLSVLNLKPWALEIFLLVKMVNYGSLPWPLRPSNS